MRRPPPGWDQVSVKARLLAGETILEIIEGFAADPINRKHRTTYAADIRNWRQADPEFAVLSGAPAKVAEAPKGKPLPAPLVDLRSAFPGLADWQLAFLEEYSRTKSILSSVAGVTLPDGSPLTVTRVNRLLLPGPKQDQTFADAYAEVEAVFVAEAADRVWKSLDMADQSALISGDARTSLWGLFELLRRRGIRQGWGDFERHEITGSVQHVHSVSLEAASRAAHDISRRLYGSTDAAAALPEASDAA